MTADRVMRQRGVTLIELMVGMAVALITTLAISQLLIFSEAQKRIATDGTDAQINGSLALFTLQRDLQDAGYGISAIQGALGCEVRAVYKGVERAMALAPVLITVGADGAPDMVQVMSSSKANFSVPALITKDHPRQAANFFVNTAMGIQVGDLMLAVPQAPDALNWCSLFQVTKTNDGTGNGLGNNQVLHNSGQSHWNNPGGATIFPAKGYPTGSYLFNLGDFIDRTYSISEHHALQMEEFSASTGSAVTSELFPEIVQLQAYYGKDTNGNGVVDVYNKDLPTNVAEWQQVLTVRIALVARSTQFNREQVTFANPSWDVGSSTPVSGSSDCGTSSCVVLKVDALADWSRYRYKVFETTVPLRNMLWHS
ncbi:MAG: pilus assembly protein PilW [Betaproteobacteria bacterium HGW-Betaproteobacteria-16]|nr:MAG: pilus assembly protein PilW [Betaproteobacteria bacterium HGW-Betaproteobacteria-16]